MRSMRRQDKAIERERMEAILKEGQYGILSLNDPEDGPYGVPLSYVYLDSAIYIHGAMEGYKIDIVRKNPKACFTVVMNTKLSETDFVTNFESVMAFGKASLATVQKERAKALYEIMEKYTPQLREKYGSYMKEFQAVTAVVKVEIEEMSGKGRYNE